MNLRSFILLGFAVCWALRLLGGWTADTSVVSWDDGPAVHTIRLEVSAEAEAGLRKNPRSYVTARMLADDRVFAEVALHLKGATGSFQSLDEKPALTVELSRFARGCEFLGTTKFHLNNSAEDPGYLCEWVGGELFRAAGIPSPRVTHALVTLNGRRLGLYVLKEGFTAEFINRSFTNNNISLLEPARGQDVDGRMQLHGARMDRALSDRLRSLAGAAAVADPQTRWRRLSETLDIDRFLTFMAVEVMIGHRDGYSLAKNNFRLALDPTTGRAVFLPHGLDQLFERPNLPWEPQMAGLVARAIMDTPEGRRRYQERFAMLLPRLLEVPALQQRLADKVAQLRPFLTAQEAADILREAAALGEHISERATALQGQLIPPPAALAFAHGSEYPDGWLPVDAPNGGRLDESSGRDGEWLRITAGPVTAASWRTTVRLNPGRYRFTSRVSTRGVKPLPFGQNQGAALRVAGERPRSPALSDSSAWQPLTADFAVTDQAEAVQLICELRASAGEARFDRRSFKLTRLD